jgi:hypothetical protein
MDHSLLKKVIGLIESHRYTEIETMFPPPQKTHFLNLKPYLLQEKKGP